MQKTLSFSDMGTHLECPFEYYLRRKQARRAPALPPQQIGNVTHAIIAAPECDRREQEAIALSKLPPEQRESVRQAAETLVAVADQMERNVGQHGQAKECKLRWADPVTGWTLVVKPDEVEWVYDPSLGCEILQVLDVKTRAFPKPKDITQIKFFGVVAGLALGITQPILLVVRYLGGGGSQSTYRQSLQQRMHVLEQVRLVIRRIEASIANNDFPPRVGHHCAGCDYRNSCPAFAAWQARQQEQA